jgi:hypothetical protein
MNFNDNFDLRKHRDFLLAENFNISNLQEEELEEMASIAQVIPALKTRNTPEDQENIDIIQNAYQTTLSQFDPATSEITKDGRLKGFASAFRKNLPSKDYFERIAAELDLKNSDLAVNTTEKTAANDLLGKTSNKPGPVKKSTSDEPAAEPKVKTKKSPTLKITNPKADEKPVSSLFGDGSTDSEEMDMDKQAAKAAKSSKEFADEVAPDKTERFNKGLKFVTKFKDDRDLVDAYLKKAKDEYKLSANMIKDLKRAAGRQVEA